MTNSSRGLVQICSKCESEFMCGHAREFCWSCRKIKGRTSGEAGSLQGRILAHQAKVAFDEKKILLDIGRVVKRGPRALSMDGLLTREILTFCFDEPRSTRVMMAHFKTSKPAIFKVASIMERRGVIQIDRVDRTTYFYTRHKQAQAILKPLDSDAQAAIASQAISAPPPPHKPEQIGGECQGCGEIKPLTTKTKCGTCLYAGTEFNNRKGFTVGWKIKKCTACKKSFQPVGRGQGRRVACYVCHPPKKGAAPKAGGAPAPALKKLTAEEWVAGPSVQVEMDEAPLEVAPIELQPADEPFLVAAGHAILAVGARRASKWIGGWADRFEQRTRDAVDQ